MPQLTQLPDVILSQLFWLAITLGFIYFVIGRGMVPRILSTIDRRDRNISDNLVAAERAKAEADAIEVGYRQQTDASRLEAMKLTNAAKAESAKAAEVKIAKAAAAAQAQVDEAMKRIQQASAAARAEIANASAEMTQSIVARVAGVEVSLADALLAVEEEGLNG